MARTAQELAEKWAEKMRKSAHHEVTVDSRDTGYGIIWSVSAMGREWFDRTLFNASWRQATPGKPGPQVKFLGGLAVGYGDSAGKVINIKTLDDLDTWVAVCAR